MTEPLPEGAKKIATLMPVVNAVWEHGDRGIIKNQVRVAMEQEGTLMSDITLEALTHEEIDGLKFPQEFQGWTLPGDLTWVRGEAYAIPHEGKGL